MRRLRKNEDPSTGRLEKEQPWARVPFITLIKLQVLDVQIGKHPTRAKERADRTKEELRNENHDDLLVCHLHKSGGFVPSLGIIALDFGVVTSVNDKTKDFLSVLE